MNHQNLVFKRKALIKCLVSGLRIERTNSDYSAPLFIKNIESGELQPTETEIVFTLPDLSKTPFKDKSSYEVFKSGLTFIPPKDDVFEVCHRLSRWFDLSRISIFKPYQTGYVLNLRNTLFGSGWMIPRKNDATGKWEGLLVYDDFHSEPLLLFPYFSEKSEKSELSLNSTV